jgi:hypothetical protein
VAVAEDACATRNLKYRDIEKAAGHVQAEVLATLKDTCAKVLTTDEIVKSFIPDENRIRQAVESAGRPISPPALPFKKES